MIKKSILLSFFALLTLLTLVGVGSALTYIDSCQNLTVASETYILTQDISSAGTCLLVNATEVTIDLNGYTAESTTRGTFSFPVYVIKVYNVSTNVHVKNGFIKGGLEGISLEKLVQQGGTTSSPNGNSVRNVTIANTIYLSTSTDFCLTVRSSYNIIENVNLANCSEAIRVLGSEIGDNNNITNLTINNAIRGIRINGGDNRFENIEIHNMNLTGFNQISTKWNVLISKTAFYLDNPNTFINGNFSSSGVIAGITFLLNSTGDKFINVSYLNETFDSNARGANLIRQWYFDAQANFTNGQVAHNAQVNITNISGALVYSGTTDVNGNIPRQTLTDYVNTGGTRVYAWNYTINAKRPISNLYTAQFDMNNTNRFHQITLEKKIIPATHICIE